MVNSDCLICDYLRSEFPTKWNGTKSPILNNARFQAIADACIIIVIIIAFARHRREHLQSSTYVETHGCWQLRQRVYFSIDFASFWTRRARAHLVGVHFRVAFSPVFASHMEHEIAFSGWKNLDRFLWLSWLSRHWFITKDIEWKPAAAETNKMTWKPVWRCALAMVAVSATLIRSHNVDKPQENTATVESFRMKNHFQLSLTHWCLKCDFDSLFFMCGGMRTRKRNFIVRIALSVHRRRHMSIHLSACALFYPARNRTEMWKILFADFRLNARAANSLYCVCRLHSSILRRFVSHCFAEYFSRCRKCGSNGNLSAPHSVIKKKIYDRKRKKSTHSSKTNHKSANEIEEKPICPPNKIKSMDIPDRHCAWPNVGHLIGSVSVRKRHENCVNRRWFIDCRTFWVLGGSCQNQIDKIAASSAK